MSQDHQRVVDTLLGAVLPEIHAAVRPVHDSLRDVNRAVADIKGDVGEIKGKVDVLATQVQANGAVAGQALAATQATATRIAVLEAEDEETRPRPTSVNTVVLDAIKETKTNRPLLYALVIVTLAAVAAYAYVYGPR